MAAERRQKKLVNVNFQRAIAVRIFAHSILFVWTVFLVTLGWLGITGLTENPDTLIRIRTVCLTAIGASTVVVLPAIVYDSIKFSHRMAGPILRLQNMLPSIGIESVGHAGLRKDDFWQDFAAEFNAMLDRVEALRQEVEQARADSDPNHLQNPAAVLPINAGLPLNVGPTLFPFAGPPAMPGPTMELHGET